MSERPVSDQQIDAVAVSLSELDLTSEIVDPVSTQIPFGVDHGEIVERMRPREIAEAIVVLSDRGTLDESAISKSAIVDLSIAVGADGSPPGEISRESVRELSRTVGRLTQRFNFWLLSRRVH